jgi:hypothetical protein
MAHIYVVQMDVPPAQEAEFNRVYDEEHVPMLSKVPGVRSAARYRLEETNKEGMARYMAVYELDTPDVIKSQAWHDAGEWGDWSPKIRPHTTNRSHSMFRKIG